MRSKSPEGSNELTPGSTPGPTIGRRDLFRGAVVLAVPFAVTLEGCSSDDEDPDVFRHGIASGDPLPDAIILWTRVTGEGSISVDWSIASDPEMTKVVGSGTFVTNAERDYTVKVDARGLTPATTYYYRFRALGGSSKVGRTRTAPVGPTNRLRFAMVSCASYAHGWFHAYRTLSEKNDLDAVIHLGDYIYEYADGEYGDARKYEPPYEILNLSDYRTRHSYYKRDPNVQAVHRQHPFITVWDDHETVNNAYVDGAADHDPSTEGPYADRKAAAKQAYREWMPYREQDAGEIFRKLSYGDLVDIVLLDTRLHARTKPTGNVAGPPPTPDPTRTLLGDDQAAWMESQLKTSTATWRLLAQQVMVGNLILKIGREIANLDQWHGYPESRNRFLNFLRDSGVKDTVILTGDIHSSWANEIVVDPNDPALYDPATGKGSLAVEFVTPGVTSPGIPDIFLGLIDEARPINPQVRFVEATKRGFVILDITTERIQAAWHHFADITVPEYAEPQFAAAWSVARGQTRLVADPTAAPPQDDRPKLLA